jgi:hypothetical protein
MAKEKQIKPVAIATRIDGRRERPKSAISKHRTKSHEESRWCGAFEVFSPSRDFMATFPLTHRLKRRGILDSLGSAVSLGIWFANDGMKNGTPLKH